MSFKATGTVKVKVFRYNPEKGQSPSYKTYDVPVEEKKTLVLQLLKDIFEDQDRTLAFRYYSCGFKFCNSCMMMINGQAKHACMTTVEPGDEITVEPLKGYPVIRDLVVDFGRRIVTPEGAFLVQTGTTVKKVAAK